jgi:hypothetical protein
MAIAEMRTGKVLVVSDGKNGPTATQKISFGQPFDGSSGAEAIQIQFENDYSDPARIESFFSTHRPDLLVLSRYTSQLGSEWIRLARGAGIPVVFHIDDDLLAVPRSLGEAKYSAYNRPKRLSALRRNIESCDLLYVSTSELAKRFNDYSIGPPVIAGDIYCSVAVGEIGATIPPATGPVIGYMGTSGHSADLAMVLPAISDVMDAVPELQFELFGTIEAPPEMGRYGRRVRHLPPVADYADFIPHLRSLGWWIGVAPLEDNAFNRCKADTKWVEYSLAGMAVVASDLPVYERACGEGAGLLADGREAWRDSLLMLLHQPALLYSVVGTAQQKLRRFYTHEKLREQVMRVFETAFTVAGQ